MSRYTPHIISVLVVLTFAYYYFIHLAFPVNIGFTNAVIAFSSLILLGFSFILGPLSRLSNWFLKYIKFRKQFGLWGFGLATIHTLLAPFNILTDGRELMLADIGSLAYAAIAFTVFLIMTATSTNLWVTKLGYDNWKRLQRTGYLAYLFVLFHVLLLEQGIFLTRLSGQVAMGFILIVLLLRIIVIMLHRPAHAPKEDLHF